VLEEVVAECHAIRVPLLIARCAHPPQIAVATLMDVRSANAIVEETLAESGLLEKLGGPRFTFRRVHEAVSHYFRIPVLGHHLVV
jgi:hypothetical protein